MPGFAAFICLSISLSEPGIHKWLGAQSGPLWKTHIAIL